MPTNIKNIISDSFPFKAPRVFMQRVRVRDLSDPLWRQVVPQPQLEEGEYENQGDNIGRDVRDSANGYSIDPLHEQDGRFSPLPGVLHKYYGRVLLLLTSDCPINCRFCFRRYVRVAVRNEDWPRVFEYLQGDQSITEVILSGGEPLLWSDVALQELLQQLAVAMPQLQRIRIHTRMPIVMPERITAELVKVLHDAAALLPLVVVIHCNHIQEIDDEVVRVLAQLRCHGGITLLNQSVLLKGVNDSVAALVELSEKLFRVGVLPYYLHMLDKVKGAAHFAVDEDVAHALLAAMRRQLPGYLVPHLVRDVGGDCKAHL
jgi:L-lysine 2,3-aminomutase